MREFYNPFSILKSVFSFVGDIFDPPKQSRIPIGAGGISTPEQDAAAERKAKEEATRKTRVAAAARGGRRRTLLAPAGVQSSEIGTARRTLLGAQR